MHAGSFEGAADIRLCHSALWRSEAQEVISADGEAKSSHCLDGSKKHTPLCAVTHAGHAGVSCILHLCNMGRRCKAIPSAVVLPLAAALPRNGGGPLRGGGGVAAALTLTLTLPLPGP